MNEKEKMDGITIHTIEDSAGRDATAVLNYGPFTGIPSYQGRVAIGIGTEVIQTDGK